MRSLLVACGLCMAVPRVFALDEPTDRVADVVVPGCVAVWDFVKREPEGGRRAGTVPPRQIV